MPENECDVDDILCHLEVLRHLRGLQQEVGKESFTSHFPEFAKLGNKIADEITKTDSELSEAVKRCSPPEESMTEEEIQEALGELSESLED